MYANLRGHPRIQASARALNQAAEETIIGNLISLPYLLQAFGLQAFLRCSNVFQSLSIKALLTCTLLEINPDFLSWSQHAWLAQSRPTPVSSSSGSIPIPSKASAASLKPRPTLPFPRVLGCCPRLRPLPPPRLPFTPLAGLECPRPVFHLLPLKVKTRP